MHRISEGDGALIFRDPEMEYNEVFPVAGMVDGTPVYVISGWCWNVFDREVFEIERGRDCEVVEVTTTNNRTGVRAGDLPRLAFDAALDATILTGRAIAAFTRNTLRALHAVITVTKRHVPAWVGALLTVALLIPGPVDELLVLLLVAGFACFKPEMRADFRRAVPLAWKGDR